MRRISNAARKEELLRLQTGGRDPGSDRVPRLLGDLELHQSLTFLLHDNCAPDAWRRARGTIMRVGALHDFAPSSYATRFTVRTATWGLPWSELTDQVGNARRAAATAAPTLLNCPARSPRQASSRWVNDGTASLDGNVPVLSCAHRNSGSKDYDRGY